jgi:ADP-ribose pyrophosphatase YjhB (NUDIX family)
MLRMPTCVHLATGILVREGMLLMVASHYPNQLLPIWNLPGGRQLPGELLEETVAREFFEETGRRVEVGALAYVSESYDADAHFINVVFQVEPALSVVEGGVLHDDTEADHIVAVEWVAVDQVRDRVSVAVVRDPLVAYLDRTLPRRYAAAHDAGITIEWPPDSS